MDTELLMSSIVWCRKCGYRQKMTMPRYASKTYYKCPICHEQYYSRGRCCIFCQLGDTNCPPAQERQRTVIA